MAIPEVINIREISEKHPVILFDGDCKFCNFWVQFVLKRDKKNQFYFTSLQSEVGKSLVFSLDKKIQDTDSIIVVHKEKIFLLSDAIYEILKVLNHPVRYLWFISPKFLRNRIYRWIARNRHRLIWWQTECVVPDEEGKKRFLKIY
ncbi:MAG: DUF393 domain-containing protein [Saprospiraceae bacterium]|nr:DUF393 domain-containing protein [Saprospiraceae bacterium]